MVIPQIQNNIAYVSLQDPARRNALGSSMFDALDAALAEVSANSDVRVLLLAGKGPAFCSGFDLMEAAGADIAAAGSIIAGFVTRLGALIRHLRRMPQPVVASVHGAAIAGGCALLSACDIVVADASTRFGYPVHRLGISPAVTIPTLSQLLGEGAARSLLMSGELIDAREARRIGLVAHVEATLEQTQACGQQIASQLASKPPGALQTTKAWLNELDESLSEKRFAASVAASSESATTHESASLLAAWRADQAKS